MCNPTAVLDIDIAKCSVKSQIHKCPCVYNNLVS